MGRKKSIDALLEAFVDGKNSVHDNGGRASDMSRSEYHALLKKKRMTVKGHRRTKKEIELGRFYDERHWEECGATEAGLRENGENLDNVLAKCRAQGWDGEEPLPVFVKSMSKIGKKVIVLTKKRTVEINDIANPPVEMDDFISMPSEYFDDERDESEHPVKKSVTQERKTVTLIKRKRPATRKTVTLTKRKRVEKPDPETQEGDLGYRLCKKKIGEKVEIVKVPCRAGREVIDSQVDDAQCKVCVRLGEDDDKSPYLRPGDDPSKGYRCAGYGLCQWTKAPLRWDDELLDKISARILPELKQYGTEVVKKSNSHLNKYITRLIHDDRKNLALDESPKRQEAFDQSQWLDKRVSETFSEISEVEEDSKPRLDRLDRLSLLKMICRHAIDPKTEEQWHTVDGVSFETSRSMTVFAYEAYEASNLVLDKKAKGKIKQHMSRMRKSGVIENSPDGSQRISIRSFKMLGASEAEVEKLKTSN